MYRSGTLERSPITGPKIWIQAKGTVIRFRFDSVLHRSVPEAREMPIRSLRCMSSSCISDTSTEFSCPVHTCRYICTCRRSSGKICPDCPLGLYHNADKILRVDLQHREFKPSLLCAIPPRTLFETPSPLISLFTADDLHGHIGHRACAR